MRDPTKPSAPWSTSPTEKMRTTVRRSVTALLDELAPERVLKRVEQLPAAIEQYRTPTGCVLQTPHFALSVSWFGDAGKDATLGELHVRLWRGTVARRGATRNRKGATIISELVLRPVAPPAQECQWQATDGSRFEAASLAAHCLALLEGQIVTEGEA